MTKTTTLSRRSFLAMAAASPVLTAAARPGRISVGLELYSVRDQLKQDLPGTLQAVARMGYECVEFYAPYYEWTVDQAKAVRKQLDDLGVRCFSTHNSAGFFEADRLEHAMELNRILGSKFIIMASTGPVTGIDGWKRVADTLNQTALKLKPAGMRPGFHNHQTEWSPVEGKKPMEVLAANTVKGVVLQLDVGTCLQAGSDPVAWIRANPGRIVSIHCKDWSPDPGKGYSVLFGEGSAPWKKIFQAAEQAGGVEYYLVEQEGSAYPALETAERCLATFRKLHPQSRHRSR